jgi:hypothetical protein
MSSNLDVDDDVLGTAPYLFEPEVDSDEPESQPNTANEPQIDRISNTDW